MTASASALLAALLVVLMAASVLRLTRGHDGMHIRRRVMPMGGSVAGTSPDGFRWLLRLVEVGADPDALWPVTQNLLVIAAILAAVLAPVLALVSAAACGTVLVGLPVLARRRRAGSYDEDLIAASEMLVSRLSVGASLRQALEHAADRPGPVASELRQVVSAHQRGAPLGPSLDRWAVSSGSGGARLLADAVALAGASGGSQARALGGVVSTLRERRSLTREVAALGSQARTSALVLVVTPIVFAALVVAADARIRNFVLSTPAGWVCLSVGLSLDAAGAWWMHRMTRWVS